MIVRMSLGRPTGFGPGARGLILAGLSSFIALAWVRGHDAPMVWVVVAGISVLLSFTALMGVIGPRGYVDGIQGLAALKESSDDDASFRKFGALIAAFAAGGMGGASYGVLGGALGALCGVASVLFASQDRKPRCQQCRRRHRDHWSDPICGDGFRWSQEHLNSNPDLWLTQDLVAVLVGVAHKRTIQDAQALAARVFKVASDEGLVLRLGDEETIQQREVHRIVLLLQREG